MMTEESPLQALLMLSRIQGLGTMTHTVHCGSDGVRPVAVAGPHRCLVR